MTELRYHRHQLIDWFSQEAISRTKVAVIGAGAVGNEVIKNLALLGVGKIKIYDFDRIESHNLTRSVLFREVDVGRHKAAVAAERAMELDSNTTAIAVEGDFWQTLSLSELSTFDVVFCCVDNFEARIRCNTLCYYARVDFLNLGIDSRFCSIEIFPFSKSTTCGCLECGFPDSVYRRIGERYSCGHLRKVSFIEKKIPTTIITSALTASLATSFGLRLGTNEDEVEPVRLYVDTIHGSLTRTTLARVEGCVCCGRHAVHPTLVTSSRDIESLAEASLRDATVLTSDPILVGYRVAGSHQENILFKNASSFNSDFPQTVAEDPGSVDVEIRDQFTLQELVARFEGYKMPCKFAIVAEGDKVVLCEFEGDTA